MPKLNFFSDNINVADKRVILRLDFNVPIKKSNIIDDTRIRAAEPLISDLIYKKAKIILISHLGRPKGKKVSELTLKPIFEYLKKRVKTNMFFFDDSIDIKAIDASKKIKSGEILFLENIRFFKEEEFDDSKFASDLSKLGDIYINDAFSCSHRKQASLHMITRHLKSYAGPLLKKEINSINLILNNKKKPVTCIIGGSKVSSKINVLKNLAKNSDYLIIVGAMANNFLKYKGLNVGSSVTEPGSDKSIAKILSLAKEENCKVLLPIDCVTSKSLNGLAEYKKFNFLKSDDLILDIGKDTIKLINEILDKSNTVFWNGPAGYFENEQFRNGSVSIGNKLAENTKLKNLTSVIGGGDTIASLKDYNLENSFTHLSTAGGAFLEYLEGKELPAIRTLYI
tara:strand:- start:740 stop:1930 length:1191 start_codon:yes stop_codon:yes gene_type:complete